MTHDIQGANARLREKIAHVVANHPELEDVVNDVIQQQPANASSEQVQDNLRARARAIIKSRPDLEDSFRGLT
jgi:hypothetical protein